MLTALRQTSLKNVIKRSLRTSSNHNGYIVLVPEIGEDAHHADGILTSDGLPSFNDISIEICLGCIGHQAAAVEKEVLKIASAISKNNGRADISRIFHDLDRVSGPLDTTWGIAKTLYLGNSTLIPTKSYMNIHERARNARAAKLSNRTLYEALSKSEAPESKEEQRLMQKYLLEGKLNGLSLNKDMHDSLREIILQLSQERANFKNKVNMAVHTFAHLVTDYNLVKNFPAPLLEAISKDPSIPSQGPWKIMLQPQIVDGFLKYCPDRTQRWNVWQANVRKASGQLDKSLENSTHLEKIRALRKRQANLLGYPTYAALSMETKMVHSTDSLKQLFAKLFESAGPAQHAEIQQLQNFATAKGFQHKIEEYDVAYWHREYLHSAHNMDERVLREYFPLPRVLDGLFNLCEKLFNIKISERKGVQVWQSAVKYYDVFDCDSDTSAPVGGFYIDCYSKENKFGKNNGWMVSIRNRNRAANITPLAALIFTFTEPVFGKPYLLSFDDLRMIFKTFGSALQHLLTKANYSDVAGLSNVEWDASQVSAHVICNLLDDPAILKSISAHYGNDAPIPDEMAASMRLLKTHLAGYRLCQELYYAHLDIEMYQSNEFWLNIVKRLWAKYRCTPLDKKDSHPCSMTEIFSDDWAAALFSYLYSKIIAADITNAFGQNPTDRATVGKRYKDTFLASGGSIPAAEVFRRFHGRDPSVEALLKELDLHDPTSSPTDA